MCLECDCLDCPVFIVDSLLDTVDTPSRCSNCLPMYPDSIQRVQKVVVQKARSLILHFANLEFWYFLKYLEKASSNFAVYFFNKFRKAN